MWRKSSRSSQMGACVELAAWRKSSRSTQEGQCVEVADLATGAVAVRDSKNPSGPMLVVSRTALAGLAAQIKAGRLEA
jgi:hypothetical protein